MRTDCPRPAAELRDAIAAPVKPRPMSMGTCEVSDAEGTEVVEAVFLLAAKHKSLHVEKHFGH